MISDDTTPFDIQKPRFYHNLNWDIISGEHSSIKMREFSEDLFNTTNLGYRLPQDVYEFITIHCYLGALARGRKFNSKRELELKNVEDRLIEHFNDVITWRNDEPKPDYQPKIPLTFRLLGNPFHTKPDLTIPRLKPDIQPNNAPLEKYGTIRTERIRDIFHRYEQAAIKPYYYPMTWVHDSNGNLHLQCSKTV